MGVEITSPLPAIPHGTYYYSISGAGFTTVYPATDQITGGDAWIRADANDIYFLAPVHLPHGAVVTVVIVAGNEPAEAETWKLTRVPQWGGECEAMATANINTEDSTITNPTIDNENYTYSIATTTLDLNDIIYGVRITYTL